MTQNRQEELTEWWFSHSGRLLEQTLERSNDYSALDLDMLGEVLQNFSGRLGSTSKAELGCWFYLWGKMARALGAICEGRAPSDDTAADIEAYALMIQRIRQTGGKWPW